MTKNWTIDWESRTVTDRAGFIVRFDPDPDEPGAWNGTPVNPEIIPPEEWDAAGLARRMRQAGDAWHDELRRRAEEL